MPTAILILYKSGGGSEEIQLVKQVQPARFDPIKRSAIRYLEKKYETGAVEMFKELPFEFWHAKNDFGDSFDVLYMTADMGTYVDIENEVGIWRDRISYGCPAIANALDRMDSTVRFIAVGLQLTNDVSDVAPPSLTITSTIVEEALNHPETLIGTHGAASGLDRVHTAFHGYLEYVCDKAGIVVKEDAGITDLFARLREEHPALVIADPDSKRRIDQILRGMSRIVDALDPIRNQQTFAHPSANVLDDAEAMLAINLVRSMLRYLDSRLR
jgi:hypothetical protein